MKWLTTFISVAVICQSYGNPVTVVVRHDVSPKECARGPEYWCQDLKAAKSCGAVKHCIQDVWQHMTVPKDDNEICDTCKKMVQEARDQLQSNETQDEIKQVLEGTCRIYFPIKVLANECIKYVDEFIPEFIEMLLSRMDPQLVCATAGLCNAESIKAILLRQQDEKPTFRALTPGDCQDCKKFMEDVLAEIQNDTQADVKNKMLESCKKLPRYSEACHLLVEENFAVIYDYLKNRVNPGDACQLIGMCDETTNIARITSLIELYLHDNNNDPECDFCKQLTAYAKQVLTANSTEEEVKEMLLGICKNFGGYEKQCEDFVNDNFQEIYDFLTDELDLLCGALGICPSSTIPMIELSPAKPFAGRIDDPLVLTSLESNDVNHASLSGARQKIQKIITKFPFTKNIPQLPNPEDIQLPEVRLIPQVIANARSEVSCALCEYGLHEIQNYLMNNKTEEAIKDAIEHLCQKLPQTVAQECGDFVDQYGDAILALLAQEIDPSQVCTKLKLCPGKEVEIKLDPADIQLSPSRLMPMALAVPSTTTNPCETCRYVVGVAQNLIGDNKTEEAIDNALKNVCQKVPKSFYPKCKKLISFYDNELRNLLKTLDASSICSMMKLCLSSTVKAIVPIKDLTMGKCDVCVMIVDYLDKLLEEQPVESEITKVLEEVCNIVPQSAREQCRNLIDVYGPFILQILAQLENSTAVCQTIELCDRPAGQVHLLGGDKCTFGPTYWCQSELHAKACKAVEHCKEKVWKN